MRAIIGLSVLGFLVFCSGEARAQSPSTANDDLEAAAVDSAQRTPSMVVHEPAILPQQVKATAWADALKKQTAGKTPTAVKATDKGSAQPADKTSPTTPHPATPIVIPVATVINSEMASTGNPKYDQFIAESAARNGVDPNLIVAVMRQESGFNLRARSYKGATGLMQLMPATAARFGVGNIYDPQQNIEGGTRYLRFLLDTFNGDVSLVLAGYNAGENAVVNSGFRVPRYRETQNYVRSISARYNSTGPGKATAAPKSAVAPAAASFDGGASSRLSNNY